MIDQTSQFFAILTNIGAAKQANADALGVPWKISKMGVGDANGTDPVPDPAQTRLINERRRAPLNQLRVDDANSAIIIGEQVIPAEVGGWWIREIGLYDADDDLIAIANCAPSFKPLLSQGSGRTQVVRVNLLVSNASNVELKIDPSVVLATRDYVDRRINEPSGVKPGSYTKVQVNVRGLVVAGTNPTTLAGYGIRDGYTIKETDRLLSERPVRDWITTVGMASDDPTHMYMRRESNDKIYFLQQKLGFMPVRQGGGVGQRDNTIKIGYSTDGLKVTVDVTDLGNLWYSANFDPNSKANWGATLAAYGIVDAYTKSETDERDLQRPIGDAISHVGFAADNLTLPYFRSATDGQVYYLERRLGFTPIEQGGGPNMRSNKVRLGFNGGDSLRLQVDATDLGDMICDSNLPGKVAGLGLSAVGSYAFARMVSHGGGLNQGTYVAGSSLLYSSTQLTDGTANNSGLIGVGTWRVHGAFTANERTLFQRIG